MQRIFIAERMEDYDQAAAFLLELMDTYSIFLLKGNLGAGKTTLVQKLCDMIGTEDVVTSPTFALINPYMTKKGPIYHMDMYRIEKMEEAIDFGIEEYLWENQYCFIEWPDKIEPILPEKYVVIRMQIIGDETREIKIETIG